MATVEDKEKPKATHRKSSLTEHQLLSRTFNKKYEEANAETLSRGLNPLESREVFCQRKIEEFHEGSEQYQKSLENGIQCFFKKDSKILLFKNITSIVNEENLSEKTPREVFGIDDETCTKMYNLAIDELNQKNYQNASDMFLVLCWLDPLNYLALLNLGLAESLLEHRDTAQEIYESCLSYLPNEPLILLYAADNTYMLGNKEKAQEFLKKCLDNMKESSVALGQSHFEMIKQMKQRLNVA